MSSVHLLREFIGERLSAAASEIFSEFEKTILRYEEELDRQRRLLDVSWKPELKLHRVDLQLEPVHRTERILTDQQLCNQERNSSLDQEEPEPPHIKEEEQELCTNQAEDQLPLKQETDPFMLTDPNRVLHIFQSSAGPEDQDSGSHNTEWSPKKTDTRNSDGDSLHANKVDKPATSEMFSCKICGETFSKKSLLIHHITVHKVRSQNSDSLQYCCPTCGKTFSAFKNLVIHIKFHTGEKPFWCKVCGKRFTMKFDCKRHMLIHTGEKPFSCQICEKRFNQSSNLKTHMMIHTEEKAFFCQTCGKRFNHIFRLKTHMKAHTG